MTAGRRAADRLVAEKRALADAITEALYSDMPELMDRHGEYGRGKCHEDMLYNLEHLAPAVDLGDPAMFAGYVRWLRDLLEARGVGADEVARSLRVTRRVVEAEFTADEAAEVSSCVDAGIAALSGVGEAGP